jgi:hypothetical protein
MDPLPAPRHPVLHYLAVVRAARDFGLHPDELDPLALHYPAVAGSVEGLADAVAAALLADR